MDYKEKYENALERARKSHDKSNGFIKKEWIETIFPELAENEDEKTRKEIIYHIQNCDDTIDEETEKRMLAWLEKQAEPQPYRGNADTMRKNLIKAFKSVGNKHWGGFDVRDIIHYLESKDAIELEKQGKKNSIWKPTQEQMNAFTHFVRSIGESGYTSSYNDNTKLLYSLLNDLQNLEKQGEQKPIDKIESKFKIGDWVVQKDGSEFYNESLFIQVTNIDSKGRIWFTDGTWLEEKDIRLWTIEDAKDGDVLVSTDDKQRPFIYKGCLDPKHPNSPVAYCGIDTEDELHVSLSDNWWTDEKVQPANAEQRVLLFSKMGEAGYTWDADKKALVMIGTGNDVEDERYEELMKDDETSIKQKPAKRSDKEFDDFFNLESVIDIVEMYGKGETPLYGDDVTTELEWLKSLRDRLQPRWKPTDEQIEALGNAIEFLKDNDYSVHELIILFNDLQFMRV